MVVVVVVVVICHSLSLASVKSRLVLPFWYRPTRVVPEKEPLNGCVCVCVCDDDDDDDDDDAVLTDVGSRQ